MVKQVSKDDDGIITVAGVLREINADQGVTEEIKNDLRYLLAEILGTERGKLILYNDRELSREQSEAFREGTQKLKENHPVHYIINKKNFMGLDFFVDERVLIPRFDTEILVEAVIHHDPLPMDILELCTGSGAIAISLAHFLPQAKIVAIDISAQALKVAEINKERLLRLSEQQRLSFFQSDLFSNVGEEKKFDVIVANPPYISESEYRELEEKVKKEPVLALLAENEGLFFYDRILKEAAPYLKDKGAIYFEIGSTQSLQLKELGEKYGWTGFECIRDFAGLSRVVKFCKG